MSCSIKIMLLSNTATKAAEGGFTGQGGWELIVGISAGMEMELGCADTLGLSQGPELGCELARPLGELGWPIGLEL